MNPPTVALPRLHPAQQQIIRERRRFNVLKCGRRFGKTSLSEKLLIEPALAGYPTGYWAPTYKDLNEVWQAVKLRVKDLTERKDEQVKQITLSSGGKIDFWSMEDPDSGRGRKYMRAVMDECEKASKFKEAWEQTIRATLADYRGDAWFLSTPKFGKTYFKEIYLNSTKYGNWQSWAFTSYDNPYISKAELDEARQQLDPLIFDCEFMAMDVDLTLRPFAYAFSQEKHIKPVSYTQGSELVLSFDFNVDPITCVVMQFDDIGRGIRFIREYRLQNSNIYELTERIQADYPNALLLVTGDATGNSRSALTRGNLNYYQVIRQQLGLGAGQMRQPIINPSHKNSRVLCNSLLSNGDISIDPSCTYLIEDLKYVEVTDQGDIDKTKDAHRGHLLDGWRYALHTFHGKFLRFAAD